MARADLFYGLFSVCMVLGLLTTGFGVFLILYYFLRFIPKVKQHNRQIVGMIFVTLAAFLRFLHSVITLGYGPEVIRRFFYLQPNGTQMMLRLSLQLYYPLVIGTLTLQVLIWVEFVLAVKSLKPVVASWSPRLKWMFFPCLALLFILEFVTQTLQLTNTDTVVVYQVYRAILAAYIVVLLVVAVIFAIRLFVLLRNTTASSLVDSNASVRVRLSRQHLTRLVMVSCSFVLLGLIFSVLYSTLAVDSDINVFWPFIFCLRLLEYATLFSLLMTALAMMRNRIAFQTSASASQPDGSGSVDQPMQLVGNSSTLSTLSSRSSTISSGNSSSSGPSPKRPLVLTRPSASNSVAGSVGRAAGKELREPLMDYSGFGSTVESEEEALPSRISAQTVPLSERRMTEGASLLDAPSSDSSGYEYQRGELAWAQYRMDGLWYAVRVTAVHSNEVEVDYLDYDLTDTLPSSSVCPDYNGFLTGERLNPIRAFDSRPTQDLLREHGEAQPDTFGLVRLRGKSSKKPNHASLLLKRGSMTSSK